MAERASSPCPMAPYGDTGARARNAEPSAPLRPAEARHPAGAPSPLPMRGRRHGL